MRRALIVVLAGGALASASCKERAAGPPPEPAKAASCAEQVRSFSAWVAALDAEGKVDVPWIRLQLARTDLPARDVPVFPAVQLRIGETELGGREYPGLRGLDDALREQFLHQETLDRHIGGAPLPREVSLYVPPDSPWREVRHALQVVQRAGVARVHFAVEGRSSLKAPPPAKNTQQLIDLSRPVDPAVRPPAVRNDQIPSAWTDCPQTQAVFARMSHSSPEDTRRVWREEIPEAILACECQVDFDAAKNQLWAIYGRFSYPPHSSFSVRLPPGDLKVAGTAPASEPPVLPELADDAPWSEAWQRIEALSRLDRPVRLE
jgi:hypothetical protein